jgi:hypothetical protein
MEYRIPNAQRYLIPNAVRDLLQACSQPRSGSLAALGMRYMGGYAD